MGTIAMLILSLIFGALTAWCLFHIWGIWWLCMALGGRVRWNDGGIHLLAFTVVGGLAAWGSYAFFPLTFQVVTP